MKTKILIITLFSFMFSKAQLILTEGTPSSTIDFSASMQTSVGNGAFTGSGFQANPTIGQLDSDAWSVTGWSDGNLTFGGLQTTPDYTRGTTALAVSTGGIYSYRGAPQSIANPCLMFQPIGGEFNTGGTITLKITNNGTTAITQLSTSYNIFVRNDQGRSSSLNFSYSTDNITYTSEPSLNYISTAAADALGWVQVGSSPSKSITTIGLNIAPSSSIYIRWTNTDVSGTGSRDEIGLDDITCTALYTSGCTTPVNQTSLLTASNITPTTADFSWTNGGGSSGTTLVIRPTSSLEAAPVDGTYYTANQNLTLAPETVTGSNNKIISQQFSISNITGVNNLSPGNQYTITAYSYNIPFCYLNSSTESATFYTPSLEPTSHTLLSGCSVITPTQINVLFNAANLIPNANGYLILSRFGSPPTGLPSDGILYSPGDLIGNSTVVGYTNSTVTSFSATGLNSGTTYYFLIIPYGSNGSIAQTYNYKLSGTIPQTAGCNTTVSSEINVRGMIASNPSIADGSTSPTGLNNTHFGTVVVGNSQIKNFRIENTGNAALNITSLTFIGGNPTDFALTGTIPTFPLNIAGGTSIDISVAFSPTAIGVRNTTLTITNNDSNEGLYDFLIQGNGTNLALIDINIKGNGQSIPNNSLFPSGTNWTAFGLAIVGSTTVTRTFTIENLGSTILNLTGAPIVTIFGTNASQFSISTQPTSTTIGGGSFLTFDVTFNPSSPGLKNATISIANSDSDENPYNFNISGNAKGTNNIYVYGNGNDVIKGSTTTSVSNLTNFGAIAVTTGTKQNTFIISNLSGSTRYFSSVSISGTDASMFTIISNPTNNSLGNGNSTSFTINFTPTSAGLKTAIVTFETYTNSALTTPDPIDSIFTFAISGNGSVYTSCVNNPVQTIAQQNFETSPSTPTWGYAYTTDGNVAIAGGAFDNGSGAKDAFIDSNSFQFAALTNGVFKSAVIELDPIDLSQYNNINLSLKVAAFRGTVGQGLDVSDFVQIESSIDNGTNWSTEAILKGYSDSRWDFDATGVFNSYYTGTNNGASIDTRNGNAELLDGLSTFFVRNLPPSSNLLLRITISNNRPDEIWAIDDIKIEGQIYQSTTWNGSSWSSGFPNNTTKAFFTGNYITNTSPNQGSIQACECEIKNNTNVIVDSNYFFEIQNDLKNFGTLTFENNSSLIQINDGAVNTGNITYKRDASLRRLDYTYVSAPISVSNTPFVGYNINNISATPASAIYQWNPTAFSTDVAQNYGNWTWAGGTTMTLGKGYLVRAPSSFNPTTAGTFAMSYFGIPNNGIINTSISRGTNTDPTLVTTPNGSQINNITDNYNLLGNPYPSAISASQFLFDNKLKINGNLSLWTHGNLPTYSQSPYYDNFLFNYTDSDYFTYTFTGTSCCPAAPADVYIGAGQGFFIEMLDGTAGSDTVEFNNGMRKTSYTNNIFYKTTTLTNSTNPLVEIERHRIWIDINSPSNTAARALVGYIEGATSGKDQFFDYNLILSGSLTIYTIDNSENYLIQGKALPFNENDTIPIGFYAPEDGQFNIAIGGLDGLFEYQNIYLEDQLLNVIHDLKSSPYPFNASIGENDNRFVLRFTNPNLATETNEFSNSVLVATPNNNLNIKSYNQKMESVSVYDLFGREIIKKENVMNNEISINSITAKKQVLVVKIKLENGAIINKKIILN